MVPHRPDEERLAAWRELLTCHARITRRLARELEERRGLPLAFYDVLASLSEAQDGRLRMQELAEDVLFSRSGLTRLADRMERAGLLRRERCAGDRRGTYAVLTSAGRSTLRRAMPVHLRVVEQYFARCLGDSDVRRLRAVLAKLDAQG